MANHIGCDDHNSCDWSATETAAPVIVRAKCKTLAKNFVYILSGGRCKDSWYCEMMGAILLHIETSVVIGFWFKFTGAIGSVTVDVAVEQDGATLNSDFVASESTFSFSNNDNTSQSYIVSIQGDDIPEPNEDFLIRLVNPTGGARVASGNNILLS